MSAAVCARPKHALGPVGTETSFFGFASGSRLRSSVAPRLPSYTPFPFRSGRKFCRGRIERATSGALWTVAIDAALGRWDDGNGRRIGPSQTRADSLSITARFLCPTPSACLPVPAPTPICNAFPEGTGLGDSRHFLARFIMGDLRLASPHFRLLSAPKSLQLSCPPRCLFPTSAFPGVFGLSLFPRFNLGNYSQDKETLTLFSAQITSRPLFLGSSRSVLDLTVFS